MPEVWFLKRKLRNSRIVLILIIDENRHGTCALIILYVGNVLPNNWPSGDHTLRGRRRILLKSVLEHIIICIISFPDKKLFFCGC